jgi:hypothetical protein
MSTIPKNNDRLLVCWDDGEVEIVGGGTEYYQILFYGHAAGLAWMSVPAPIGAAEASARPEDR